MGKTTVLYRKPNVPSWEMAACPGERAQWQKGRPDQTILGLRAERVAGLGVEGSIIPLHKQRTFIGL